MRHAVRRLRRRRRTRRRRCLFEFLRSAPSKGTRNRFSVTLSDGCRMCPRRRIILPARDEFPSNSLRREFQNSLRIPFEGDSRPTAPADGPPPERTRARHSPPSPRTRGTLPPAPPRLRELAGAELRLLPPLQYDHRPCFARVRECSSLLTVLTGPSDRCCARRLCARAASAIRTRCPAQPQPSSVAAAVSREGIRYCMSQRRVWRARY